MSLNAPRPPRPPRPGGGMPGTRPAAPPRNTGLQSGPTSSAAPPSDFGDTRTVILSRKNMGMHQKRKDEDGPAPTSAPAPAPVQQLPKARVHNNTVSCVSCSGSFPILGDEYYGAVVECPDCSAEFIIPSKQEVMAQQPAPAPVPAPPRAAPPTAVAPAPAPVPAPAPAPPAAVAPAPAPEPAAPQGTEKSPASKPKTSAEPPSKPARKKRAVKKVPPFVESELKEDEEVFACETASGGSGSAVLAAVFALLAGLAGMVPAFVTLDKTMAMAIPGGAGVLFAIIAFVACKGGGGDKALVVTEKRVFAKSGKWFAESDLD